MKQREMCISNYLHI